MKISRHAGAFALFLWFSLLVAFETPAAVPRGAGILAEIKADEPPLSALIAAYFKHEGLDDRELRSWEKKIKAAPFLPVLYVGYDHQLKKAESLSITDNISVSSGAVTVGPDDNDYDLDNNTGVTLRARAVWNLNDAVFNPARFNLASARLNRARLRERARDALFTACQNRYAALGRYFEIRSRRSAEAQLWYAKYLLWTERVDEMTGGRFSDSFWRES